jgi:hypothetical protein
MSEILTKQKAIDEIVKHVRRLDKEEVQNLLTELRIKKMQREGVKPAASPKRRVKPPTMEELNRWTHEARNYKHVK